MSYRNDHDAAIARVDALTHELHQTQAERERLEAEREQLQSEVRHLRESPLQTRMSRKRLAFTLLAILAGVALETFGHDHHRYRTAPPPPPPPARPSLVPELQIPKFPTPPSVIPDPTPASTKPASTTPASTTPASTKPASTTSASTSPARSTLASTKPVTPPAAAQRADPYDVHIVAVCAANTQRALDGIATLTDLRPLRASCRKTIESVVRGGAISLEARQLLTRWLELEDRLAPSLAAYNTYILRDPTGTHYRAPAALRAEFDAALRARSAVLTAIPDALNQP